MSQVEKVSNCSESPQNLAGWGLGKTIHADYLCLVDRTEMKRLPSVLDSCTGEKDVMVNYALGNQQAMFEILSNLN